MPNKKPKVFTSSTRYLSVTLMVLLLLTGESHAQPIVEPSQWESATAALAAGTELSREILPNQIQRFALPTQSGQYVHISIDKGDLRLSLALCDPDHRTLSRTTSHRYETLKTSFVSRTSGTYHLYIRSLEGVKVVRRFQLKVDALRPARANDLKEALAQQVVAAASELSVEWKSTSLRKALANYLTARSVWESTGKWREAANAAINAADIHFALGEYRQSLLLAEYATSAFSREKDWLGRSRALSRAGQRNSLLGDNKKGQSFSSKALDYYSAYGTDLPITLRQPYSEALNHAGEVYYSIGDLVSASVCFQKSLNLFIEVGDRGGEARSRLFLGYISTTTGDIANAIKHFERTLDLSRDIGNRMLEALCLTAIGIIHSSEWEDETAIKMHRSAMDIFRLIGDRQSEAVTLSGIGQAYQDLNEGQAALVHYRQALRLFEEHGNADFAAVALYQIAKVHEATGNAEQAEVYYTRCLKLSQSARKKRLLAYATNDLAALHMSRGRQRKAFAQYWKAFIFYERIGDRRGQAITLNKIGDFYLTTGNKSRALSAYERAYPLSQEGGEREVEILTLYNIAKVEKALGALEKALASIKAAIDIIEKLRSNVASPDLRLSYFSNQRKHYDLYIDLLMRLDLELPGQDFAAAALLAAENSRARSLTEILAHAGADIRRGAKPEILNRERELQDLLRAAAASPANLVESDVAQVRELTAKVDVLRTEYKEIQGKLREHHARYEALTQQDILSIADIQAELRDGNTLLLEYSLGEERSYLWSVTANSLKGYILPGRGSLRALPVNSTRRSRTDNFVTAQSIRAIKLASPPVTSNIIKKRLV